MNVFHINSAFGFDNTFVISLLFLTDTNLLKYIKGLSSFFNNVFKSNFFSGSKSVILLI